MVIEIIIGFCRIALTVPQVHLSRWHTKQDHVSQSLMLTFGGGGGGMEGHVIIILYGVHLLEQNICMPY